VLADDLRSGAYGDHGDDRGDERDRRADGEPGVG
jgi:hypothetical protein